MKYREAVIYDVVLRSLRRFSDARGWLIELFRQDELDPAVYPVMAYVSETLPGVARGPHEHRDQTDVFGFLGPGDFKLYLWDARPNSTTFGCRQTTVVGASNPTLAVIPPGVVHAYKNVGQRPGWVFNAPNRLYAGWGKKEKVDEIRHEEIADSPFILD